MTQFPPETPRRKASPWLRWLPVALLVAAAVVAIAFSRGCFEKPPAPPAETAAPAGGEPAPAPAPEPTEEERRWAEATGEAPVWPEDFASPTDCDAAFARVQALCARLDDRDYVRDWKLPGGVLGLVVGVSNDLAARPPADTSGSKDPDALAHGVAHLYRVLGEERLARLLTLVRSEPEMAEPMAMALYRWTAARERCGPGVPAPMALRAQYDYAAYFVRSVGGQAYLRRRPPRLEALASLYAVLTLDAAISAGHDPLGIDLRPEIERARALVSGSDLLFRSRYLDVLGGIDRRWRERAEVRR